MVDTQYTPMSHHVQTPLSADSAHATARLAPKVVARKAEEPLPTIGWLNTVEIQVDHDYQHNPYRNAIDALKTVFRPEWMGFILVNVREDGSIYVIDGNTRTTVCRELGMRRICAEIRHGLTQQEEAAAYTIKAINTQRQPVDLFKAECVAGVPEAIRIQTILRQRQIEVRSFASEHSPRTSRAIVACVATLRRLLRREDRDVAAGKERAGHLQATIDLIVDTWDYETGSLGGTFIETIYDLLDRYDTLVARTFKTKLAIKSHLALREEARGLRFNKTPQPSLRRAMQEKILEFYNYGLPKDKRVEYGA